MDYSKLCQKGLDIDPQIRFSGILDHNGRLVFGIHKDGVTSLLDDDELKMSIHYTFQRWKNLQNLEYFRIQLLGPFTQGPFAVKRMLRIKLV